MPGWELVVTRLGLHQFAGHVRTYGAYQVFIDDAVQPELVGYTLEAHGPGDNSATGKGITRVEAGRYSLGRHVSTIYKTEGFSVPFDQNQTLPGFVYLTPDGVRDGLLIHPAHPPRVGQAGNTLWLSSIGCINPTHELGPSDSADFDESSDRVVALIESFKAYEGKSFDQLPLETGFSDAFVNILGEPMNNIS